ncbi:superoxide dismutase [Candidatus Peregrinibacteria bacterium]|nr:superoxide dismutase [Candidatus Peregrinibacteria bacterium]
MSYTWNFNPRPYSDEEAKKLLSSVMSPETTDWHYNKHHKGYVTALNTIETSLPTADTSGINGNYSAFGELKRRLPWNHAGALLHDLFWYSLGGDGDHTKAPTLMKAIEKHFGSFDAWKMDFINTAMGTKLSGWAVLTDDQLSSQRLLNVLVDDHQNGAIWGGIPLLALDMFEHAYYHKDGANRAEYIKNFFANLHWERLEKRYLKYKR